MNKAHPWIHSRIRKGIVATLAFTSLVILILLAPPAFALPSHLGNAAPLAATPTPRCTVQVPTLNLRSGPSTAFNPPLRQLARNTALTPDARFGTGSNVWIRVRVSGSTGATSQGWVNASTQYVSCNIAISALPVATNVPGAPLPAVAPLAVLPNGAEPNDDIGGDLMSPENLFVMRGAGVTSRIAYTQEVAMQLNLTRLPDDAEDVSIYLILYDTDSDEVYVELEPTDPPYCFFGATGSACNTIPLTAGARWPNGQPITNGQYRYSATVDIDEGLYNRNWNGMLEIDSPALTSATAPLPAPPVLVVLPPGPGGGPEDLDGNLVASPDDVNVYTNDAGVDIMLFEDRIALAMEITSVPDGAEVDYVDFQFIDDFSLDESESISTDASEADDIASDNPIICSFGVDDNDCSSVDLDDDATWPGTGTPIHNGYYLFSARVYLDNGSARSWGGIVEIRNDNLPPDPAESEGGTTESGEGETGEGETGEGESSVSNDYAPEAMLVETAPGTDDPNILEELAFRVAAWDPDIGDDDGDGIESALLQG